MHALSIIVALTAAFAIRNTYLKAINASLSGCEPFKFTAGLGDAIAGRPIMIRYVDNRDLEKQPGAR